MASSASGLVTPFHRLTSGLIAGAAGSPEYSDGWSAWCSTYITWVPPTPSGSYSPALAKPRSLRSTMRSAACTCMSSLLPKTMAPVGQVFTQAGSRPTATRSLHRVHL
ncbi:hypothetical protein D3C75_1239280 [compost metagenome]